MRLDVALGHRATVIHCPTGQRVSHCVWVDDQTHQYAVVIGVDVARFDWATEVRQARLIVICAGSLVLIDPIDPDAEKAAIEAGEVAHA